MKKIFTFSLLVLLFSCATVQHQTKVELPAWMKGRFMDDYKIQYTIDNRTFVMEGSAKYHILEWNEQGQYLLAQNDTANKTDKRLFTRIDYMRFSGMEPFNWGYCFTIYNAVDTAAALKAAVADRANPKKGCNGYPFSRMKRID